jgi:TetR/AcrR family transcriptional regulator, transcriptional repressor for nem operon
MGRPREFDERAVLAAAGETFWSKGYEATSTRDLAASTGLTASSIYAAFGDKRGLYLRALDQYLNDVLRERIARLEASLSPGQAIAGYFAGVIDRSLADPHHRGCMLVNTALEATENNPDIQRIVADETITLESFFERCIVAGRQTGEIATDQDAGELARHLLSVALGLRVLARVRPDRELFEGLVRPALAMLGLPPLPARADTVNSKASNKRNPTRKKKETP